MKRILKAAIQMVWYVAKVASWALLILAIWHGWSLDIGSPDGGFQMRLFMYPLKRFFYQPAPDDDQRNNQSAAGSLADTRLRAVPPQPLG